MNRILRMASGAAVMALVLAMTVMMTACSTEGDGINDGSGKGQQPETKAASIRVTVRAGIGDEGAAASGDEGTRSEMVSTTNSETGKTTRTLTFTQGDRLYVYKSVDEGSVRYVAGMLTMTSAGPSAGGQSATFTGDLVAYDDSGNEYPFYDFGDDPLEGSNATLIHEGMADTDYFIYSGTINFNQQYAADVETLMTKWLTVTGDYVSGSGYTLTSKPIINCALSGLEASTEYSVSLLYSLDEDFAEAALGSMTTDATGAGTVAFASKESGSHDWKITVTKNTDNSTVGTISLGSMAIAPAKLYNVYRHWNTDGTYAGFSKTIDLSKLGNDVTVRNGMTLTGELYYRDPHKISIAAGATVTLSDVDIPRRNGYMFAGLTCLGDATIVLADGTKNSVSGIGHYPAIQAGPSGTTLTIRGGTAGTGSLTAESYHDANGNYGGAGIGGGQNMTVGNIRIEGGQITVIGGDHGAGIGCGEKDGASASASCGHITITGGEVTATGGSNGAGIGSGEGSKCGDISISGGTVNATGGSDGAGIGSGAYNGSCGNITISGGEISAQGGNNAAGIGSGNRGDCGNISISGGEVTANGGISAAGIGSGHYGSCGGITISGGEITAQGEGGAAGIGSGRLGNCGVITITGGTGTATGGSASPNDIGEGVGGYCGTVSVADGTILATYIRYACTLTLVYSYTAGIMGEPIYNVSASQIEVSVDGRTYYAEGSSFTNFGTCTVNLPAGSDLTLTVTSPSTSYQQEQEQYSGPNITTYTHDFVGTLTNVTIPPDGTNNLGTVNLVRQLP